MSSRTESRFHVTVRFAPFTTGNGFGPVVTLFDVPTALKTSNGGAVSATLSLEAALWTYNLHQRHRQRGQGVEQRASRDQGMD